MLKIFEQEETEGAIGGISKLTMGSGIGVACLNIFDHEWREWTRMKNGFEELTLRGSDTRCRKTNANAS